MFADEELWEDEWEWEWEEREKGKREDVSDDEVNDDIASGRD